MPRRRFFKSDTWEFGFDSRADEQPLAKPKKGRAATMVVYAALFFAGATFTAFAGDHFAQMTSSDDAAATSTDSTSTDTTTTADGSDPASSDALAPSSAAAPADSAPDASSAPAAAPSSDAPAADPATAAPGSSAGWSEAPAANSSTASAHDASGWKAAPAKKAAARNVASRGFVLLPVAKPASKPEIEGPAAAATVWLNRALPDPTPAALRLSPKFARHLKAVSQSTGLDWALMLGVLRAQGAHGHNPATAGQLMKLALRLSALKKHAGGAWATALAYQGRPAFADKALALERYDRAVGLNALVRGLEATKKALEQRLLNDPQISIYPGGRDDIAKDKVDVRVLATIAYLRQAFGSVTVSCLISGHRLYARPGVISAHIYGRAVDISALGNTPILGHQQPGGLTEQAVHDILLLPNELMPKQVISLLGLGGPSFPLADHYNHIHIGW
jgi:hypothetical protein